MWGTVRQKYWQFSHTYSVKSERHCLREIYSVPQEELQCVNKLFKKVANCIQGMNIIMETLDIIRIELFVLAALKEY
jgi:hypothetical protein